jgi:hypothetical protein
MFPNDYDDHSTRRPAKSTPYHLLCHQVPELNRGCLIEKGLCGVKKNGNGNYFLTYRQ